MVSGLHGREYENRLVELDMLSLEVHRKLYDLVQTLFEGLMMSNTTPGSPWWATIQLGSPGRRVILSIL